MTHLTEEQFIDILMGEPRNVELDQHLASCEACQMQMHLLKNGFTLAKAAEPEVPELNFPSINHRQLKKKTWWRRIAWGAAAAMFLLSILGFRMEVDDGSVAFEFALFGNGKGEQHQMADLEERLLQAIDMNATMAQRQIDERFNAIFQEGEMKMGEFRSAVAKEVEGLSIENDRALAFLRDELNGSIEKLKQEGNLR